MFERFTKSFSGEIKNNKKLTDEEQEKALRERRKFMVGGVASVATLAGMASVYPGKEDSEGYENVTEKVTTENISEIPEEDIKKEDYVYDEKSNSEYFNTQVTLKEPRYESEVEVLKERLNVLNTIVANFHLTGIENKILRQELEGLFVGVAIEESRLNVYAESERGAFSAVQIMPATWKELHKKGEMPDKTEDVTKVAVRLMEQSYRHVRNTCSRELEHICNEFFEGNNEDFEKEFLAPLLINSYNAGMGSMATLVKWFITYMPTKESTVDMLDQSETLTGYDVFYALADGAEKQGIVDWYKEHASGYTFKAYAAKNVAERNKLV